MYRFLVFTLILVSNLSMHEFQTPYCDINTIVEDPAKLPMPSLPDTGLYTAMIEKNFNDKTSEYREFYDGVDNVGVVHVIDSGEMASLYFYYQSNELLISKSMEKSECFFLK